MGARAIWKGVLTFEDVEVPVRFLSAVEDRRVHFRLLHADDEVPVEQRMVRSTDGEEVAREDIRRGFAVDKTSFVVLTPEELDELQPPPSREVEMLRFVEPRTIGLQWYDRPYYLAPDGDDEAYAALAKAIEKTGRIGIAQWVMRNKTYHGALSTFDDALVMVTLRPAETVIATSALPRPEGDAPSTKERKLANQLVDALEGTYDPADYDDEYRSKVLELVRSKAEGKAVKLRRPKKRKEEPDTSLEEALRASLGKKGKRVA
jgi:DNA end-binding protein Ku